MCILVGLSSEHRQHCRKRVGCESADYACHLSLVGSSGVLYRRSRTKEMYKCFLLVIIACSLCEMTRMQEMGCQKSYLRHHRHPHHHRLQDRPYRLLHRCRNSSPRNHCHIPRRHRSRNQLAVIQRLNVHPLISPEELVNIPKINVCLKS